MKYKKKEKKSKDQQPDAAGRLAKEGFYSESPEVNQLLIDKLQDAKSAGFVFEDARAIPYGSRLQFRHKDKSISANIYFSKKKGYSVVVDQKVPDKVVQALKAVFLAIENKNNISEQRNEQSFKHWIGSDEAGKGEYLGPLVTVAFYAQKKIVPDLRSLGIRDSKTISNSECRKMARTLFKKYASRIAVVELVPTTYNRLYGQFKSDGKNLNRILEWSHSKAIEKLLDEDTEAVVIDKFANNTNIKQKIGPSVKVIERHRAEDNVAVAAASVLARARYLYRLDKLSDQYGVKLLSGAGKKVDDVARKAVKKHGEKVLLNLAKLHFKNTEKIKQKG